MKNHKSLTLGIVLCGVLSSNVVQAANVTWMLSDVVFNNGSTAEGSFVFDADTDSFISFDITTSSGNTYGDINPRSPGRADLLSTLSDASAQDMTNVAQMFLQFAEPMTNTGGTIDIVPGFIWSGGTGFSWEGICTNADCSESGAFRDVASGQVTTVPEPATLALLGLGGMTAIRRKK